MRIELSLTHLDERSHNSPAHAIQEPVSFDDEREERPFSLQIAARQAAHCRASIVMGARGKGLEIVAAKEQQSGVANGGDIEWARHMPGGGAEEGIHGCMIPNEVPVLFFGRIEAGMEILRNPCGGN